MSVTCKGNSGNSFSNSWWYWRPLAFYCFEVAPIVCNGSRHYRQWETNDGSMSKLEAAALAKTLQDELDSGRTLLYLQARRRRIESMPDEPCYICGGKGQRTELVDASGMIILGSRGEGEPWECNKCGGLGTVRPMEDMYPFDLQNVQDFANFLRLSEGFTIT